MTVEWNDEWGTPEEHQIDTTIEKHEGFSVGERVVARSDGDEDSGDFWFEGDEGVIIGFAPLTFGGLHPSRTEAVIAFEGQDPMSTADLGQFDPADE